MQIPVSCYHSTMYLGMLMGGIFWVELTHFHFTCISVGLSFNVSNCRTETQLLVLMKNILTTAYFLNFFKATLKKQKTFFKAKPKREGF